MIDRAEHIRHTIYQKQAELREELKKKPISSANIAGIRSHLSLRGLMTYCEK